MIDTFTLQRQLKKKGFNPGALDGIMGPMTEAAISAFKRSVGLRSRPYVGPLTLKALFGRASRIPKYLKGAPIPPWVGELGKHMGMHEVIDNKALKVWLKSDGSTLGDPARLPWCGDAIETAIKLTMPNEKFTGRLLQNPYWALNWMELGVACEMAYGAVAPMKRPGGGHIAVVVGYDPRRKRVRVRGGNQSNMISDTWVAEHRIQGYRKPATWKHALPPVPIMNSKGLVVSTNEA